VSPHPAAEQPSAGVGCWREREAPTAGMTSLEHGQTRSRGLHERAMFDERGVNGIARGMRRRWATRRLLGAHEIGPGRKLLERNTQFGDHFPDSRIATREPLGRHVNCTADECPPAVGKLTAGNAAILSARASGEKRLTAHNARVFDNSSRRTVVLAPAPKPADVRAVALPARRLERAPASSTYGLLAALARFTPLVSITRGSSAPRLHRGSQYRRGSRRPRPVPSA
jgi:hypothetical protein